MGGRHPFQHRRTDERTQSQIALTCEIDAVVLANRDLPHALVRNHQKTHEDGKRTLA